MKKPLISIVLIIGTLFACTESKKKTEDIPANSMVNPTNKVVLSSEIDWEKLNPARGDKSPQAGTIWGDRKGTVATGFLAKFVDGFSSPPHIHNVTYRAVVIKGKIHNDDPEAENMWMGPGSFWTQPKGESHITSTSGTENIAYVEIDSGPYLVKPISEAFDSGERPINLEASNVVWLGSDKTNWVESDCTAQLSFLWEGREDNELKGLFIKLPTEFEGKIESDGNIMNSVVISGVVNYTMPQSKGLKSLDPGSYFSSVGDATHIVSADKQTIIYVRTDGVLRISNTN